MTKKGRICILSNSEVAAISVLRAGECPGGFQRKLNKKTVDGIVESAKNGRTIPAITVGEVGSSLIVVDGQHRIEARRVYPFELAAYIKPMTKNTAILDFISCNTKGRRVRPSLISEIDPSPLGVKIRKVASTFKAKPVHVYNLLYGIATRQRVLSGQVSDAEINIAENVLFVWTRDSRWGAARQIFSHAGTLSVVGNIARNSRNPGIVIKKMQNLNFSENSPLASRYGTSGTSQKSMRAYIATALLGQI